MVTTILEDLADEFVWNRIETTTDDNGLIQNKWTEYDNGTTRLEDYENGVLRFLQLADFGPTDARTWESIETYYDINGTIEARFQVNDNGVEILTQYENGVRRYIQKVDQGQEGNPSGVKYWKSIEVYYDVNGQLETRFQVNDDGVEVLTQYENGVRRSVQQVDLDEFGGPSDAETWERIDTYYDTNGLIEIKYQVDDNGVTTMTQYRNGKRFYVGQRDTDETGGPSAVKNWESIDTHYDANGVIVAREQLNDNGKSIATFYQNGSPIQKIIQDTDGNGNSSDQFKWDRIFLDYTDGGDLLARTTEYDNGDITAFMFEEGQRAFKFEVDGDDSEDWVSRETIYDTAGNVIEVNLYDYDIFNQTPTM